MSSPEYTAKASELPPDEPTTWDVHMIRHPPVKHDTYV
jgi:hypothetical protein